MKASVKHESIIQGELFKHLGKSLIESLPQAVQMGIYAEWRAIINEWKKEHDGEIPNAKEMELKFGEWHKQPPADYIESLNKEK